MLSSCDQKQCVIPFEFEIKPKCKNMNDLFFATLIEGLESNHLAVGYFVILCHRKQRITLHFDLENDTQLDALL